MTDLAGETIDVLFVKGSGWDMAEIEPAGFAAVDLAPLRRCARSTDLATRTWPAPSAPG